MIVDDLKSQSPKLRDRIKRIEIYYNLVQTTQVENIKEHYKELMKKNLALLTQDGIVVDLNKINYMVDTIN